MLAPKESIKELSMLSFIPNDVVQKLILLVLGASAFLIVVVLVVKNKKKMSLEVWIPLVALCVLGTIGMLLVSICVATLFVIAD